MPEELTTINFSIKQKPRFKYVQHSEYSNVQCPQIKAIQPPKFHGSCYIAIKQIIDNEDIKKQRRLSNQEVLISSSEDAIHDCYKLQSLSDISQIIEFKTNKFLQQQQQISFRNAPKSIKIQEKTKTMIKQNLNLPPVFNASDVQQQGQPLFNNICDDTDKIVEISDFSSIHKSLQTPSEIVKRLPTQIIQFNPNTQTLFEDSVETRFTNTSEIHLSTIDCKPGSLFKQFKTNIMLSETQFAKFEEYNVHQQYSKNKQARDSSRPASTFPVVTEEVFETKENETPINFSDNEVATSDFILSTITIIRNKMQEYNVNEMSILFSDIQIIKTIQFFNKAIYNILPVDLRFLVQKFDECRQMREEFSGIIEQRQSINDQWLFFIIEKKLSNYSLSVVLQLLYTNTQIYQLSLINQDFSDMTLQLCNAFLCGTKLIILELDNCSINSKRLHFLQSGLSNQSLLRLFNISNNSLQDNGCVTILQILASTQSNFEFLGFSNCQASDGLVIELASLIYYFKNLTHLDFSNNPGITKMSFQSISSIYSVSNQLVQFYLANISLTARQFQQIFYFSQRNSIVQSIFEDFIFAAVDYKPQKTASDSYQQRQLYLSYEELLKKMQESKENTIIYPDFQIKLAFALSTRNIEHKTYIMLNYAIAETMGRRDMMEDVQLQIEDFYIYRTRRQSFKQITLSQFQQKTKLIKKEQLFCLFDGHGGRDCSEALEDVFPAILADTINHLCYMTGFKHTSDFNKLVWEWLFNSVFLQTDIELKKRQILGGSTAVIIYICNGMILTANCGDSRAIVVRKMNSLNEDATLQRQQPQVLFEKFISSKQLQKDVLIKQISEKHFEQYLQSASSKCIFLDHSKFNPSDLSECQILCSNEDFVMRLSKDHRPSDNYELMRIQRVNGYVNDGRVQGFLSVSRAFGDFDFQPAICCVPYISLYYPDDKDIAIVMCCDGVSDVLADAELGELVFGSINCQSAAIKIRDCAYTGRSADNISVCVIRIVVKKQPEDKLQ